MKSTLRTNLYNSRRFNSETSSYEYVGAVADLISKIESECSERGLNLYRWQNSSRPYFALSPHVTYAIMSGDRPDYAKNVPSDALVVGFVGFEGKTEKCEAYRKLSQLLGELKSL